MLNSIIIMGRLTRDPELRRTGSGLAVANFSVAVERDFPDKTTGQRETDFIDCVAWRQTGEFVSKWFTKGSMIVVSGRLQMRSWDDKDTGKKRVVHEILAENVYFGESKKDRDAREATGGAPGGSYAPAGFNPGIYTTPATPQMNAGYFNYPYPNVANPNTQPQPNPYTYPAPTIPASDFAMLEDDEGKLPF